VGQPVNVTLDIIGLRSALDQYKASAALIQTSIRDE